MLVLSRFTDESVVITPKGADRIIVRVVGIKGDRVRIGFEASQDVAIHREEIQRVIDAEQEGPNMEDAERK